MVPNLFLATNDIDVFYEMFCKQNTFGFNYVKIALFQNIFLYILSNI